MRAETQFKSGMLVALLLLIGGQYWLQQYLLALSPVTVSVSEDFGRERSPRAIRVMSAGRVSAVVDALLIRVLTDDRTHWVRRGQHPAVFHDLKLAISLDPWGPDLYLAAGRLLAVIRNDPAGAREILLRGAQFRSQEASRLPSGALRDAWAKDWPLLLTLLYVEAFELQDFSKAAALAQEIALIPGAPPWIPVFASRLKEPGHLERMGLRILDSLLESARSEGERRELSFKKARLLETLARIERPETSR